MAKTDDMKFALKLVLYVCLLRSSLGKSQVYINYPTTSIEVDLLTLTIHNPFVLFLRPDKPLGSLQGMD